MVKGGVSVDVGVRAFMPASRSGAKDAAEMEKLVGQEIRCRIIKLNGGTDNGAPGVRPEYSGHYYAAFALDPDGNNVEAVFHTPVSATEAQP